MKIRGYKDYHLSNPDSGVLSSTANGPLSFAVWGCTNSSIEVGWPTGLFRKRAAWSLLGCSQSAHSGSILYYYPKTCIYHIHRDVSKIYSYTVNICGPQSIASNFFSSNANFQSSLLNFFKAKNSRMTETCFQSIHILVMFSSGSRPGRCPKKSHSKGGFTTRTYWTVSNRQLSCDPFNPFFGVQSASIDSATWMFAHELCHAKGFIDYGRTVLLYANGSCYVSHQTLAS